MEYERYILFYFLLTWFQMLMNLFFKTEQFLTPEKFAEILCEDLELPLDKFVPPIAESIRSQVLDFEAIHEVELPPESIRVVINVSVFKDIYRTCL